MTQYVTPFRNDPMSTQLRCFLLPHFNLSTRFIEREVSLFTRDEKVRTQKKHHTWCQVTFLDIITYANRFIYSDVPEDIYKYHHFQHSHKYHPLVLVVSWNLGHLEPQFQL